MNIDTLTATLQADVSGFTPVVEKAGAQLRAIGGHGETANRGLTVLRRGFESLAIQATGVSGPVGRVSQGLLMLGAGSSLVLGVAAGIGLITTAFKVSSREVEHWNDVIKKAQEGAQGLLNSAHAAAVAQRAAIRGQLEDAKAALQRLQQPGLTETGVPMSPYARGGAAPNQADIVRAQAAIRALEAELAIADAKIREIAANMREPFIRAAKQAFYEAKDQSLRWKEALDGTSKALENLSNKAALLQLSAPWLFAPSKAELGIEAVAEVLKGSTEKMSKIPGAGGETAKALAENLTDPLIALLKQAGYDAGRSLVEGIIQGTVSLGDILKNFIMGFVADSILGVLKAALLIGSPSGVGIELGRNFATGLAIGMSGGGPAVAAASQTLAVRMAGSATFRLNMSGMPAATNPLAAARDRDYQRFFRESAIVATHDGFKFT